MTFKLILLLTKSLIMELQDYVNECMIKYKIKDLNFNDFDIDWGNLIYTEDLEISHCRFNSFKGIDKIVNLQSIDVNYCEIKDNDMSYLHNLTNLRYLTIDIKSNIDFTISDLRKLKKLYLYNCVYSKVKLLNLPKLKTLNLGDNIKLEYIDDITSSSIMKLLFRESVDGIENMKNLKSIDCYWREGEIIVNDHRININKLQFNAGVIGAEMINYKVRINKSKELLYSLMINKKLVYIWNSFLNKTNKEGYNIYSFLN